MLSISIPRSLRQAGPAILALFCAAFWAIPAAAGDDSAADRQLFAVEIRVGPGWDPEKAPGDQAFFGEHSAHLRELRNAGHIAMGARYSDVGLLVVSAASEDPNVEFRRCHA